MGTHTHIPTNDARILNFGTAYQTDAGMCGDYDSVIGMDAQNSINRFFKRDFFKDQTKEHFLGENKQAAEPVFIPKKNAVSEDDGFVIGFVYDKTSDSSEFVIIDANNFSDKPIATVSLPQRVPFGFHGSWINLD